MTKTQVYESPEITVLGHITDMTHAMLGMNSDFPGSTEGNTNPAPSVGRGTTS